MGRTRHTPTYSLDEVKHLAREGRMIINRRSRTFITNRYDCAALGNFVRDLICSVEPQDFYKSDELEKIPGTFADIYKGTFFEEEEWYIKLFIDEEGQAQLNVLSANWDGYIH